MLKEIGEFGFIRRIQDGCEIRGKNVIKGIGDDAAVFKTDAGSVLIATTDFLVENVHFRRRGDGGFNLGHKSLAVNLSDIAAMGAVAREAFVSLAIPEDVEIEFLDEFYRGMKALAGRFDVNILGGDTTRSTAGLVISVFVVGEAPEAEILYRHAAAPSDRIVLTGTVGESRAGLQLILDEKPPGSKTTEEFLKAHQRPRPHLAEGRFLAENGAHTAIDVSDGLYADLGHILTESGVGARIYEDRLPIPEAVKTFFAKRGVDPVETVATGGEDYILISTVPADRAEILKTRFEERFHAPLYDIGEIRTGDSLTRVRKNGREKIVAAGGWDHFRT